MIFDSKSIYSHALYILEKYSSSPDYIIRYLSMLLENNMTISNKNDTYLEQVKEIIEDNKNKLSNKIDNLCVDNDSEPENRVLEIALEKATKEIELRKEIEEFYLPRQLLNTIMEIGHIPGKTIETKIGVAFLDIADYAFLSKFLSPMENQSLLNGLYSAFSWVLQKRSGYLNKIEGDSMMFHFGGITDPSIKNMTDEVALKHITKALFYTCVELHQICFLFNQASEDYFDDTIDEEIKSAIRKAYAIIIQLRTDNIFAYSMNTLFQIKLRIGASIGDVTIGNFGPPGAKQWDVIGLPIIEAKRMEATAPVGALRISQQFYNILMEIGVVEDYYNKFTKEAQEQMGYFKDITLDELFQYKKVFLKDKKNAAFETYSVQVNQLLPENLSSQVKLLLRKGEENIDKIVEILEYYRGNKFVITAIESVFIQKGVDLRKEDIINAIYPTKYKFFHEKLNRNNELVRKFISETYSLHDLFHKLGTYQDKINAMSEDLSSEIISSENVNLATIEYFNKKRLPAYYKTYFHDMIYPVVFFTIKNALTVFISMQEKELEEAVEELEEQI